MVMRADILAKAIDAASTEGRSAAAASDEPARHAAHPERVRELSAGPGVVLVCGRFEGVDERIIAARRLEEISVGDYVLSGGEIGAFVLLDACVRLLPGVMGHAASGLDESFSDGLLEYPQYTRPQEFEGVPVPEVLTSGDHAKVAAWRRSEAQKLTAARRPDLPGPKGRAKRHDKARIFPYRPRPSRYGFHFPAPDCWRGATVMNLIQTIEKEEIARVTGGKPVAKFQPGDTLIVNVRIKEGERSRVQAYEGVCIARSGGGLQESFTVRKISYGEGVERVFPLYSPNIESIEVVRRGKVRRAKLYYLRDLQGKRARIVERQDAAAAALDAEAAAIKAAQPKADKVKKEKPKAQAATRAAKGGGKK
jgi:tRNA (guanine37-N1)-methyltransferase